MTVSPFQLLRPQPTPDSTSAPKSDSKSNLTTKPLFVFLSGMDGTGKLLHRQLQGLAPSFEIGCLALPTDDRSDWETLVAQSVQLIRKEARSEQAIYLCGESFGACLALSIALHQPSWIERLILINPATSFARLPWLQWGSWFSEFLPQQLYGLSAWGLEPFLVATGEVDWVDRQQLLQAMQSVHPQTASWRLRLLRNFQVEPTSLEQLALPTLLLAGERDCLLPSREEIQRLAQHLPQAQLRFLPRSGHACLLERSINLAAILEDAGFLPR